MSNSNIHRRLAPALPWDECTHAALAPQWIPYAIGVLRMRALSYWWHPASRTLGRQAMNEMSARMLLNCQDELLRVAQAQYRMLDYHLRGTVYTRTGNGTEGDPYIITPDIPDVPAAGDMADSIHYIARDTFQMVDNAVNGTVYTNHAASPSVKDLLAEISAKIEASDIDDEEMIRLLNVISLALG
jgi:hypothetical protein